MLPYSFPFLVSRPYLWDRFWFDGHALCKGATFLLFRGHAIQSAHFVASPRRFFLRIRVQGRRVFVLARMFLSILRTSAFPPRGPTVPF